MSSHIASRLRDLSVSAADLDVVARALDRDLRVVIEVDRAADIRTALEIIRDKCGVGTDRLQRLVCVRRRGTRSRAGIPTTRRSRRSPVIRRRSSG